MIGSLFGRCSGYFDLKEGSKYWSVEAELTTLCFVVTIDLTRFSLELRSLPCVSVAVEPSCEYIKSMVALSMLVSILKPEAVIYRRFL